MNFFKAVFAEPDDSNRDDSGSDSEPDPDQSNPDSAESAPVASGAWDFGGLIKTLATKSESVIDTYKRDLQEFSTGLKAETAVFREVANRAVKELPKAGVSTFDEFKTTVLKGTTQIISQGKEALLSLDQEISSAADDKTGERSVSYNRFDARLRATQIDKETYCVEPEDLEDYEKWKSGFVLEEKGEELGKLFDENVTMENIYHRIVPSEVDPETFWYRYFYKVYKLKQAEEVRASFLKKAIDDEEEELSWDVDEEEENSDGGSGKVRESAAVSENESEVKKDVGSFGEEDSKEIVKVDDDSTIVKQESRNVDSGKTEETSNVNVNATEKKKVEDTAVSEESKSMLGSEKEVKGKSDEAASKAEPGTTTDEDLEWDEIEDEGSDGEKPVAPRKSHDKAELQKRLSSAVEDEDLSWDMEDDDEPVKH